MAASFDDIVAALIREGHSEESARKIAASRCGVSKAISLTLPICKFNDEKRTVTGWAALSTDDKGRPVIDFQNDYVPIDELEKAAHALVASGGAGAAGDMHRRRAGDIVESMVVDVEKREALGFGPPKPGQPESGWAVTMRLDDEAWSNYKSGARPELSMHGRAAATPIGKRDGRTVYMRSSIEVDEISIVDRGASGNHRVQPRILLAKRANDSQETTMPQLQKPTKEEIAKVLETLSKAGLDSLVELEAAGFSDEQKKIVYALLEAAAKGNVVTAPPPKKEEKPAGEGAPLGEEGMAKNKDADEPPPTEKPKTDDQLEGALSKVSPEQRQEIEKALAARNQSEEKAAMEKRHAEEKRELEKRVTDLEKARKDLEAKAELTEMTKRAEARPFIPKMSTEAQAKLLVKARHAMTAEDFKALDEMLDAVNTGMSKSDILRQIGSDKQGDSDSPAEKLKTMAKSLQEELRKKNGRKPSFAQCYREVCRQNPEIYAEATSGE